MSTAEPVVLAVDCSTTAAKVVALDLDGSEQASASRPLALSRPRPGFHEQDAVQWWRATLAALAETIAALPDPAAVQGICLTHQRESFVCIDERGAPLRPAVLWLDSRAGAEIAELGTDRVHQVSGKPPDTTPAIYKLAWLSRHEPQTLAQAARVADVHAVLAHRLTGRWASSVASADSLGLLDLAAGIWAPELLHLAGVRADQLPDLVPPGAVIASLTADVTREVGLPAPVPLIAGLGDGQAAGLGAGAVEPGMAYLNLGTSMVLGTPSPTYLTSRAFRTLAGAPQGSFVFETVLNAAAYLADWFRRELGDPALGGAVDPALDQAADDVPPGAEGLLAVPYWNAAQTPYWDADARGALVGLHGAHTRAHVYRALLEGVAFELRLHLEGLEAATGQRISVIRAMGGGSRSRLWTQIVADVTDRPIQVCLDEQLSARGAAVLAWRTLASPSEAVRCHADLGETFTPRTEFAAHYARLAPIHRQIYPGLRALFADLAATPTPTVSHPNPR